MKKKILPLLLSWLAIATSAPCEEAMREWTNTAGRKIQAKFVSQEGDKVTLQVAGRDQPVTIAKNTLSEADNEYLAGLMKAAADAGTGSTETPATPAAGGGIGALPDDFAPVPGHPEEEVKIDRATIVPNREAFEGGRIEVYLEKFRSISTEHFLILHGSRNTKAGDMAQQAEQVYAGLSQQYHGFPEVLGGKKYLVMVASEEEDWNKCGQWYRDTPDWTESQERYWKREKAHRIKVTEEFQTSHELYEFGTVLDGRDRSMVSGKFPPLATHKLTHHLFQLLLGDADDKASGIYALVVGHSYFKESLLSGAATTTILQKSDYTRDKFAEKANFARGTDWAKTAKQMIAKEEIKPDLGDVLGQGRNGVQPTDFVLMYSLAAYLNRTPDLLRAKNQMLAQIRETKKGIDVAAFLAALGVDSEEEFQKSWLEFIASRDFE